MSSRARRGIYLLLAAAAAYALVAAAVIPRRDRPGPVDAVVVLSSGVRKDGTLDGPGASRLRTAERYAQEFRVPTLATTRVKRRKPPFYTSDAGQMRMIDSAGLTRAWRRSGDFAINTHDEARIITSLGIPKRIALVTSRFHTRRACATFEHAGFQVTCVSSGWDGWWMIPYYALYEGAALIEYRLRGWI